MFLAFKKKWNQVDKKEKKRKENVIPFFFEGSDNFSNFLLVRGGSTFWIFYDVCMNTLYKGTCFCRCVWKNFLLSKMLEKRKGWKVLTLAFLRQAIKSSCAPLLRIIGMDICVIVISPMKVAIWLSSLLLVISCQVSKVMEWKEALRFWCWLRF